MIRYLKVDNYRSLVNFKIDFSSINLLLGNNGTGKSTIFQLILNLRAFIRGDIHVSEAFTFDSLTKWQTIPVQSFELGLNVNNSEYIYKLEIEYNQIEKNSKVKKEILICNDNVIFMAENGKAKLFNDSYEEGPELLMNWQDSGVSAVYERPDNQKLISFKKAINNIIICHPIPLHAAASYFEKKCPDYFTENIIDIYVSAIQEKTDKLMELWDFLKQINPCFVRTYLKGEEDKKLYFEYNQNGAKSSYEFYELSDGERMIFILYFLVIMFLDKDTSLFLDEPDNFISLSEIVQLGQFIQDKTRNNSQCVIISHHPNLIDYFATSNGIWLSRRSYGATTITEPPKSDTSLTYSEMIARGDAYETE